MFAKLSLDDSSYRQSIKDNVNLSRQSANEIKHKFAEIQKENIGWAKQFAEDFRSGKMSFEDYKLNMDTVRSSMLEVNNEMKTLGLETDNTGSKFEKSIGLIALNSVVSLGKALLDVGKMMMKLFTNSIDFADSFGELSAKYDIGTKSLQEFNYIATQTGTDLNSILSSMTMMYSKAKENSDVFKKLGISVTDANGNMKSMDKLFWETKNAIDNVNNSGEKSALMLELFGRNAMELGEFFRKDSEELEVLAERANTLGIVMNDDVIESAGKFNDMLDELKLRGKSAFAEMIMGVDGAKEKFSDFCDDVVVLLDALVPIFADVGVKLGEELLKGFVKVLGKRVLNALKFAVGEGWLWGNRNYEGGSDLLFYAFKDKDYTRNNQQQLNDAVKNISGSSSISSNSSNRNSQNNSTYNDNSNYNIDINFQGGSYSDEDAKQLAQEIIKQIATQKQASGR